MIAALIFIFRVLSVWAPLIVMTALLLGMNVSGDEHGYLVAGALLIGGLVMIGAIGHVSRVWRLTGRLDAQTLSSHSRQQIEVPMDADAALDMIETVLRELPDVESVEAAPGALSVKAYLRQSAGSRAIWATLFNPLNWFSPRYNVAMATVTPGEGTSGIAVLIEPAGGAWTEWFTVDDGRNFETGEAIRRAISQRVSARRRREQDISRQTATEKELSEARLGLLSAQVEPHFLYNTLASAQVLVRTDPAKADEMLGNLIAYLRNSLPKTDEQMSTLGAEIDRTQAYLDILKVRMGNRLSVSVEAAPALRGAPLPAMMLQTLAENAIKHGLEPKPGGGTIWVRARVNDGQLEVTVADDGRGFNAESSGTGIGLKNVRERLRLIYEDKARLIVAPNFPQGVTATLLVPVEAK